MEQPIVDVPYPDRKEVFAKVGIQPDAQSILQKLSEILNVPVETLNVSPTAMPTGETPVWLKLDHSHPNPNHVSHGSGMPKGSNDNIGDIWPVSGGFAFKSHNNPTFAQLYAGNKVGKHGGKVSETNVQVDKGAPGMAVVENDSDAPRKTGFKSLTKPEEKYKDPVERHKHEIAYGPNGAVIRGGTGDGRLTERENPISVGTIKSQVQNFGPEALGQIVAKLSSDMDKVDANGQPTSEYNQFVESIKQDGLEIILNASSAAGGVKTAPNGQGNAQPASPAPDVAAPEEPGQELASL
jgi:hypothetical protein